MTLLQKIQNLTWWTLDIKLKDILTDLFGSVETLDERISTIEDTPSSEARPYKSYVALLTQVGTNPPTANVLENELGGTVVFTYIAQGSYRATLVGAFTNLKTTGTLSGGTYNQVMKAYRVSEDYVGLITYGSTLVLENDVMNGSSVLEIRVYN